MQGGRSFEERHSRALSPHETLAGSLSSPVFVCQYVLVVGFPPCSTSSCSPEILSVEQKRKSPSGEWALVPRLLLTKSTLDPFFVDLLLEYLRMRMKEEPDLLAAVVQWQQRLKSLRPIYALLGWRSAAAPPEGGTAELGSEEAVKSEGGDSGLQAEVQSPDLEDTTSQ